jgi:hypothetical protein
MAGFSGAVDTPKGERPATDEDEDDVEGVGF